MCLKEMVKSMTPCDVKLVKLSVFFFTLFLVTAWPWFRRLVVDIGWWWFLALGIIFAGLFLKRTCKGVCKENPKKKAAKKKK